MGDEQGQCHGILRESRWHYLTLLRDSYRIWKRQRHSATELYSASSKLFLFSHLEVMCKRCLSLFTFGAWHSLRLLPTMRFCDFKMCTWKETTWLSSFQNCVLVHYNLTPLPVLSEQFCMDQRLVARGAPYSFDTLFLTHRGWIIYITAAIFWKVVHLKEKYFIWSHRSTDRCVPHAFEVSLDYSRGS